MPPARLRAPLACALALAASLAIPAAAAAGGTPSGTQAFPRGFLWGTAIAGFQTEAGRNANVDRRSDWYAWTHDRQNIAAGRVTADRVENGPGHWFMFREDVDLARDALGANTFRTGIEWSRIFPRSTAGVRTGRRITLANLRALDRLADPAAVAHYEAVLRRIRARGMTPFVTLNHFSLPGWLHDPIEVRDAFAGRGPDDALPTNLRRGGWLDPDSVEEFRKYAAYLAWKYGALVDYWTPLNEPMVVVANGFANIPGVLEGWFPPGVGSFRAAITVALRLPEANAAAYDAIKAYDRRARVGLVHNMIAFRPADPSSARDRAGTRNAHYIFNRLWPNATIRGWLDRNADGRIAASERRADLAGKADFLGLNYYFVGRVTGLGTPVSRSIPVLDFAPRTEYRWALDRDAPPCPTTCSEFGNEIDPEGFREVLRIAGSYRRPVYVTETGIADANDDQRPRYIVTHLLALRRAMAARDANVRGFMHWSLTDNFEWSAGYLPKFGLYRYNARTLRRTARPSARVFAQIVRGNRVSPALARRYGGR